MTASGVRTVALIPARGGSKGVPGKNLRPVAGVPLVERAVLTCRAASLVDAVFVSTDDVAIADAAEHAGAQVIMRPAALAGDLSSSESVLLHALDQLTVFGHDPEVVVFVQCTSPFIDAVDLDRAASLVAGGAADSVFSAVASHEFLWRSDDAGEYPAVAGLNHDAAFRPRRQDRRPDYRETGAFYAMTVAGLQTHRHRFFGRTRAIEVPALTAVDVDTEADLVLAEAVARVLGETSPGLAPALGHLALDVDVVLTDFDGVHTDDTATVDEYGRESVRVSRSDGMGVGQLRAAGVAMVIVSKETNPVVSARAAKLGVQALQGVDDKVQAVGDWLAEHGIAPSRAAYLGNDVNDLGAMSLVGWPVAVADARPEVRELARLTLTRRGGHGAVRELCDLVLERRRQRAGDAAAPAEPATPATAQAVEASAVRVLALTR